MYTVMTFLTRRADLDPAAFADYYENRHVPLIRELVGLPPVYKRRYLRAEAALAPENGAIGFDAVTEVGFPDRAAFLAWMAAVTAPEVAERIAADEAVFLDRSKMRPYVVEA